MCLAVDKEKTYKLNASKENFFIRYKVIYYCPRRDKFDSVIYNHEWKTGWNVSNRYPSRLMPTDDYIYSGIHVFTSKEEASEAKEAYVEMRTSNVNYVPHLLEVKCYKEHFIAAGTCSVSCEWKYDSEAYTQVYVEKLPEVV